MDKDMGASATQTGLAGAEAPEPHSGLGPSDGIPSAETIALCEQFIGQALLHRDVIEEIESSGVWHRLRQTPVNVIGPVAPGKYAVDIDSAGNGWVRVSDAKRGPATVHYNAGMASELDGLPVPLLEGMKRLERWKAEGEVGEPPAAVTALWRPYRRLRLK